MVSSGVAVRNPARNCAPAIGVRDERIEGGYRKITVHQIVMAWSLHQAGHITRRQLRIYFAAHEMDERRRHAATAKDRHTIRRKPLYDVSEVAALVGGRGSASALDELRADMKRLSALGLVAIEPHTITFAVSIDQITVDDVSGFWTMFGQMPHPHRAVPVPRRTLRALAAGFGKAVTAVMLAIMLRSLFWHKDAAEYRLDGRTKGSWIVSAFGVSRRAVTDARAHLIGLDWITPLHEDQWALNKWGSHDQLNPDWTHTAVDGGEGEGGEIASPPADLPGEIASPLLNKSLPLKGNLKTRRPAEPDEGSGFSIENQEQGSIRPNLRDVQPRNLVVMDELLQLHQQAVDAGMIDPSEASRIDFVAYAERARTRSARPPALFMWLLRGQKRKFITQADEDAAMQRLRAYRDGQDQQARRGGKGGRKEVEEVKELSEDEKVVRAVLLVARDQKLRDPFRAAEVLGWTRERWDLAREAYERPQLPPDDDRFRSLEVIRGA